MAAQSCAKMGDNPLASKEHNLAFYYLLAAAGLAIWMRAMPTPFLPLVMSRDFHQTPSRIGLAMAALPFGAFLATPFATAQARVAHRTLRLHSVTVALVASSSLVMALSPQVHQFTGHGGVFAAIVAFRVAQGVSQAYYMAATNVLISRFADMAYTAAMVETATGVGLQLGRLGGGFLFDLGGFACPFLVSSMALYMCFGLGFQLEEEPGPKKDVGSEDSQLSEDQTSWKSFLKLSVFVPVAGVMASCVMSGFMDATLPQHLEDHLGPLPVSAISAVSSLRSVTYLATSWICAQLLRRKRMTLQTQLLVGVGLIVTGLILVAPQDFVAEALAVLPGGRTAQAWTCQLTAIMLTPAGKCMLYIPGLPLLQREVGRMGPGAAERVSRLLILVTTGGEVFGLAAGGALVEHFGFQSSTAIFAALLTLLLPLTLLAYREDRSYQHEPLVEDDQA